MDEQELKELKSMYLKTSVSTQNVEQSWFSVSKRLPKQESARPLYIRYGFLFASLLLFLFLGTFRIVLAAHPGDTLYPVKVLSDKMVSKVLGKPQIVIERRAKDVVDESHKSPQQLEKATKEYNNALDQAAKDIKGKDSQHKQDLKESLNKQKNTLEKITTNNQRSKDLLNEAVHQTEKTEGEVRGAFTSKQYEQDEKENQNSNKQKNKK